MKDTKPAKLEQAERVVGHYAQLAPEYDRRWERYIRVSLGTLLRFLDLTGDERLLDVACGTGRLAEMIRKRGSNVHITGTDLSPDMIAVARRRVPEDELIRWQLASAESLPFDDHSFDTVTCANAFHMFPDQDRAMAEIARVIKPGGTVGIVDWCREYPQIRALLRVSRLIGKQHHIILTLGELREKMQRAGLTVTAQTRFKATWFWGLMCVVGQRRSSHS